MNDNNVKKITDKIFSNSRMELIFFMYLPTGSWSTKDKSTMAINMNPVLYLRYKSNQHISEEYEYSKAVFKINPRNLYHVIKFFNTIVTWFYDDKYNDLFLIKEDNQIIFNADYKSLHVTTHRGDYDTQVMQAIPTVVEIANKMYEGVHLYINKSNYCIPLTFEEISILFGILRDFRFPTEITKVLAAYNYIVSHDAISTGDYISNNGGKKSPFD
jgi:hypothetical protein